MAVRDDELLHRASVLIVGDWKMLHTIHRRLYAGGQETMMMLALLDSFVIHARKLIDLFYPPKRKMPDDILASDFFDDPGEWAKLRPPKDPLLEEIREVVANKRFLHLTYYGLRDELDIEVRHWKAYVTLAPVMETFIDNVPPHRLYKDLHDWRQLPEAERYGPVPRK